MDCIFVGSSTLYWVVSGIGVLVFTGLTAEGGSANVDMHGVKHMHDEHHRHEHEERKSGESYEHCHVHEGILHSHGHWPDIHHRHIH